MELIDKKKRDTIKKVLSGIAGGTFLLMLLNINPLAFFREPGSELPELNIKKNDAGEIVQIGKQKFQ